MPPKNAANNSSRWAPSNTRSARRPPACGARSSNGSQGSRCRQCVAGTSQDAGVPLATGAEPVNQRGFADARFAIHQTQPTMPPTNQPEAVLQRLKRCVPLEQLHRPTWMFFHGPGLSTFVRLQGSVAGRSRTWQRFGHQAAVAVAIQAWAGKAMPPSSVWSARPVARVWTRASTVCGVSWWNNGASGVDSTSMRTISDGSG